MYRRISAIAAIGLSLTLISCSPSANEPSEATASSEREPLVVESAPPIPTPTPTPSETRSDRGNLIASVGDEISLSDYAGNLWATFKIEKVSSKVKCTMSYADAPAKGTNRISLTVTAKTEPAASDDTEDFYLNPAWFKFIDTNDVTFNGDLGGTAYSCIDESKLLPSEMGPAEKAKGQILLDVPDLKGTLVLDEYGVEIDLAKALND